MSNQVTVLQNGELEVNFTVEASTLQTFATTLKECIWILSNFALEDDIDSNFALKLIRNITWLQEYITLTDDAANKLMDGFDAVQFMTAQEISKRRKAGQQIFGKEYDKIRDEIRDAIWKSVNKDKK